MTEQDRKKKVLSQRLKDWRGGRTQEQAAELLGVTKARYESWERQLRLPREPMLRDLGRRGVEVEDLLDADEELALAEISERLKHLEQMLGILARKEADADGYDPRQASAIADAAAERLRAEILADLDAGRTPLAAESDPPSVRKTRGHDPLD